MVLTNFELLELLEDVYNNAPHQGGIEPVSFRAGQNLVQQDKNVKCLYVIREGIGKCFIEDENARTFIVEFLGKGEIIGEIEFLLKDQALATVSAITDMACYKISPDHFRSLARHNSRFNELLLVEMARRIRQTAFRSASQQLNSIDFSLQKVVELFNREHIQLSKQDLAAYLGTTVRSVNRSLKTLQVKL